MLLLYFICICIYILYILYIYIYMKLCFLYGTTKQFVKFTHHNTPGIQQKLESGVPFPKKITSVMFSTLVFLLISRAVPHSTKFVGKWNESIGAQHGFCSGGSRQNDWSHQEKQYLVKGLPFELRKCFGVERAWMVVESEDNRAISTIRI